MLSSDFAQTLKDDDPLVEIMIIAGELEIAPENTLELTRELIQKIEALSNARPNNDLELDHKQGR